MGTGTKERLTLTLRGLSVDEIDELVVLLRQNHEEVEEETHKDIGTLLHTVHVLVQNHGEELKMAAGLAASVAKWLYDWRERKAAEKQAKDAATRPDIVIVRGGASGLSEWSLRGASDDEVRAVLRGGKTLG